VIVNKSHQYQQNKQPPLTHRKFKQWWSTNPTNINKTNNHLSPTESLNSDGQQIPPISTKQTITSHLQKV